MTHAFSPSTREQRQEDFYEFEYGLFYILSSSNLKATHNETVSQEIQHPQIYIFTNYI